jgi:hypothetical protein
MSVALSGELVFKVTFDQHGFPIGMYTTAAIVHMCAEQIHARSAFSNPNKPEKLDNFKVELISKKYYELPTSVRLILKTDM